MSVPIGPKRTSEVGVWSPEKLEILRCYLGQRSGFLQASKSAAQRHYIDLFAGPEQNRVRPTNNTIDGSPSLQQEPARPLSPTCTGWMPIRGALPRSRCTVRNSDRNIRIYEGDANARIDDVLLDLPKIYPTFAFLDPRGTELHWQTVSKLARHKTGSRTKIELFILFPFNQGIARLMPHDPQRMVNEEALDRFMPDPLRWREVYKRRAAMTAAEFRRTMLEEYVNGLQSLGYKYVPPPRLVSTAKRQPLYFLVFASDHPAGENIMTWCLSHVRETHPQLSFLPYPQRY